MRATKHERYEACGKRKRRKEGKKASREVGTGSRPEEKFGGSNTPVGQRPGEFNDKLYKIA